jgi:hypothetical protein
MQRIMLLDGLLIITPEILLRNLKIFIMITLKSKKLSIKYN